MTEETKKLKLDSVEQTLDKADRQKRFQDAERKKRTVIRAERAVNDLSGPGCGKVLRGGRPDPHALADDTPRESPSADGLDGLPPTPPHQEITSAEGDEFDDSMPPSAERAAAAVAAAYAASENSAAPGERRKKKGKEKPKWAMTKQQALDAEDDAFDNEMQEAQGLVDFAMNLDYDKFIEDYEVREALSIMRERVEEIAEEQGIEPEQLRRLEGGSPPRRRAADDISVATSQCSDRTAALERKREREVRRRREAEDRLQVSEKDWDSSSVTGEKARRVIGDDALRLAERILAKSEALRQVHSKQSLGKILQDIVVNRAIPLGKPKTVPVALAVEAPVIADIKATDGGGVPGKERRILTDLRNNKEYVQNLPYLYRCPSI